MIRTNVNSEFRCLKTEAGNRRIPMMQQVYDVLQEEYDRQKQEGFA